MSFSLVLLVVMQFVWMCAALWLGRESDRLREELAAAKRELHVFHVAYGNRLTKERDFQ